ncbi:MAG: hypothetical protein H5T59_06575 [Anaerolineae bacterium]|nr:hypothetical protein [Anaerolineae bacterium]
MAWLWMYLPHFAVTVAREQVLAVREVPVIVAEAGRVRDCSPGPWARGVRPGQRLREARTRSPEAHIWNWDPAPARALWEAVGEVLRTRGPVVHAHPWEAWSLETTPDLEGALWTVQEVLHTVQGLRVPAQVGWAGGRFAASVAAQVVGPGQACLVAPGYEAAFLAPLPLEYLPLPEEAQGELAVLGVRTMGAFAHLPAPSVGTRFGQQGLRAWELAQGRDGPAPPALEREPEVWVRWTLFDPPLEPDLTLRRALGELLHGLGADLKARGLVCQEIVLEITGEYGGQVQVHHRPQDSPGTPEGVQGLGQTLLARVQGLGSASVGRIAELKVLARGMEPQRGKQLSLFPAVSLSRQAWHHAVVELAAQHPGCFWRGEGVDPEARLAWQRAVWRPLEEGEG